MNPFEPVLRQVPATAPKHTRNENARTGQVEIVPDPRLMKRMGGVNGGGLEGEDVGRTGILAGKGRRTPDGGSRWPRRASDFRSRGRRLSTRLRPHPDRDDDPERQGEDSRPKERSERSKGRGLTVHSREQLLLAGILTHLHRFNRFHGRESGPRACRIGDVRGAFVRRLGDPTPGSPARRRGVAASGGGRFLAAAILAVGTLAPFVGLLSSG
jgi:hypothetical protein